MAAFILQFFHLIFKFFVGLLLLVLLLLLLLMWWRHALAAQFRHLTTQSGTKLPQKRKQKEQQPLTLTLAAVESRVGNGELWMGQGNRERGRGWQREVGSQPSGVYFSNMSVLPALSITCCVCTLSPSLWSPARQDVSPESRKGRQSQRWRESERERDKASAHVRTSGTAVTISGISGWL